MVPERHPSSTRMRRWNCRLEGYQFKFNGSRTSVRCVHRRFANYSGTFVPASCYLFSIDAYPCCSLQSPDANATLNITDDCYLGRPWNDWAVTVYLNTFMEDIIEPVGFEPFDSARFVPFQLSSPLSLTVFHAYDRPTIMNTTFYAEFNSTG